ncbi:hypothetical protein XENORESO_004217, partial [Xenotaenia resolanae]
DREQNQDQSRGQHADPRKHLISLKPFDYIFISHTVKDQNSFHVETEKENEFKRIEVCVVGTCVQLQRHLLEHVEHYNTRATFPFRSDVCNQDKIISGAS